MNKISAEHGRLPSSALDAVRFPDADFSKKDIVFNPGDMHQFLSDIRSYSPFTFSYLILVVRTLAKK